MFLQTFCKTMIPISFFYCFFDKLYRTKSLANIDVSQVYRIVHKCIYFLFPKFK